MRAARLLVLMSELTSDRSGPRPGTNLMQGRMSQPRTERPLADAARFLKSWFNDPKLIGAVAPSGPVLAAAMARGVDLSLPGPIIEIGPGTGVVTRALLDRGIEPGRLVLVEFDPNFCELLRERFPGVQIVKGDAYRLSATLSGHLDARAAAVVSSLPLLLKPAPARAALLEEAFDLMLPNGVFVQFTYGRNEPIPKTEASAVEGSPRIWRNVPPARVWIYRRVRSGFR